MNCEIIIMYFPISLVLYDFNKLITRNQYLKINMLLN